MKKTEIIPREPVSAILICFKLKIFSLHKCFCIQLCGTHENNIQRFASGTRFFEARTVFNYSVRYYFNKFWTKCVIGTNNNIHKRINCAPWVPQMKAIQHTCRTYVINDISRHEKLFRKTNLNFFDCNTFDEFNLGAVNIACQ